MHIVWRDVDFAWLVRPEVLEKNMLSDSMTWIIDSSMIGGGGVHAYFGIDLAHPAGYQKRKYKRVETRRKA